MDTEIDEIISYITSAQEDGYLDTYYKLVGTENKWIDMEYHKMYCDGYLIDKEWLIFK